MNIIKKIGFILGVSCLLLLTGFKGTQFGLPFAGTGLVFAQEHHVAQTKEVAPEKAHRGKGSGHASVAGQAKHSGSEHIRKGALYGRMESTPFIERDDDISASYPLLIILLPVLGAVLLALFGSQHVTLSLIAMLGTGLTFLLTLVMYSPVINGVMVDGVLHKGIHAVYSFLPGFNFTLKVDPASLLITMVTTFLWFATTVYSSEYMKVEGKERRFAFFNLMTLMADVGVLMAGDFMTLFFFFEGLIIFPYALLAHRETKEALNGANNYLYLGVISSLVLLLGILYYFQATGSVALTALTPAIGKLLTGGQKSTIALLMIAGFGVKAGLFGLHTWMTTGYPHSPNAACALSSGGMIKAGAYGIFRVVNLLFIPVGWQMSELVNQWGALHHIGYIVIWIGTITMFMGVLGALISENSNKMLGFHSVSQMGYIVMGLGCAAYMGADGAMGVSGALYHILNHALFKAALFLGVGAVYFRTKEINMYKLGGLFGKMPVVAICLFIAVMGISGIPGFNGFASKTLLHHAIVEATEFSSRFSVEGEHVFGLKMVEIIFMLTAAGTFASNIKMFILIFLGKRDKKYDDVEDVPLAIKAGLIMLCTAIVFIGLVPNFVLEHFIGPALGYLNFNPGSHAYHELYNLHLPSYVSRSIIPILYPIGDLVEHAGSHVIANLMGAGVAVALGGMYFILGMKFGWFHIHLSAKREFETFYKKIYRGFDWFCQNPAVWFGDSVDKIMTFIMVHFWQSLAYQTSFIRWFESKFIPQFVYDKELWMNWIAKRYLEFCETFRIFDSKVIDRAVTEVADNTLIVGEKSRVLQTGRLEQYILFLGLSVVTFIAITLYFFF